MEVAWLLCGGAMIVVLVLICASECLGVTAGPEDDESLPAAVRAEARAMRRDPNYTRSVIVRWWKCFRQFFIKRALPAVKEREELLYRRGTSQMCARVCARVRVCACVRACVCVT